MYYKHNIFEISLFLVKYSKNDTSQFDSLRYSYKKF